MTCILLATVMFTLSAACLIVLEYKDEELL